MGNSLEKNEKIITLDIRLITHADGTVKLQANLKHKCKDKQTAIEIIGDYVNRNTRSKESVKA